MRRSKRQRQQEEQQQQSLTKNRGNSNANELTPLLLRSRNNMQEGEESKVRIGGAPKDEEMMLVETEDSTLDEEEQSQSSDEQHDLSTYDDFTKSRQQQQRGKGFFSQFRDCKSRLFLVLALVACLLVFIFLAIYKPVNNTNNDDNNNNDTTNNVIPQATDSASTHESIVPVHHHHHHQHADLTPIKDALPLSKLDPLVDFHLLEVFRPPETAPPNHIARTQDKKDNNDTSIVIKKSAVPTNQWFQNLLLLPDGVEPTEIQRAYTTPYMIDIMTPPPLVGFRVHQPHLDGTMTVVQLSHEDSHGLTLGATPIAPITQSFSRAYEVLQMTPLSITIAWNQYGMTSSLVKGMAYATMHYSRKMLIQKQIIPTVAAEIDLKKSPIVDGKPTTLCTDSIYVDPNEELQPQDQQQQQATQQLPPPPPPQQEIRVQREVQVQFKQSDFTWLIFVSQPVQLKCRSIEGTAARVIFELHPILPQEQQSNDDDDDLTVRVALANNCTLGFNPRYCHARRPNNATAVATFTDILQRHAAIYPGPNATVTPVFHDNLDLENKQEQQKVTLVYDWNAQIWNKMDQESDDAELISFALPHHLDKLNLFDSEDVDDICIASLLGQSCLVYGSRWRIPEDLLPLSFRAPRPPASQYLDTLSEALTKDLTFQLPDYYARGAADTYFSGKMLAKAARIILIAHQVREMCSSNNSTEECPESLSQDLENAIARLQAVTEVWINGTAEAPFVYDSAWGGIVSCGCYFNGDTRECGNKYPDCPAVRDPGLNFGNGFYNDHHFHYGYHIYAASVVAFFNPQWGRDHFEEVLLLIRDIANPSPHDVRFPLYRHKDWFQGHSWASGITMPPYLNGKNQESSSESIAAYEAVGLFGKVMMDAWSEVGSDEQAKTATRICNIGRLLATTEVRSADRYWHVRQNDPSKQIYPKRYGEGVVGILWTTMAQFQTWFGIAPFLPYGIQLLPLTPISEHRDDLSWLKEIYKPFADACNADGACHTQGWSILQLAVLASVGHVDLAVNRSLSLDDAVFDSAGGNGHSLSNTLWYILTRPEVAEPVPLPDSDTMPQQHSGGSPFELEVKNCGRPANCTDEVLDGDAGEFTCRQRIKWLMNTMGQTEEAACAQVAGAEYAEQCGECNIGEYVSDEPVNDGTQCPPCTKSECDSDLNTCPIYEKTFVCSSGLSTGGCAGEPWTLGFQCRSCCELTACNVNDADTNDNDATKNNNKDHCPPCSESQCSSELNSCPAFERTFVCDSGQNVGGCSGKPWAVNDQCSSCCELTHCNGNNNPSADEEPTNNNDNNDQCPPCTESQCSSKLNRCPAFERTFVCATGSSTGGCSGRPWPLDADCKSCCEMTDCPEIQQPTTNNPADECPPCSNEICFGRANQCPLGAAPFLCVAGSASGGCSPKPWRAGDCQECCNLAQCSSFQAPPKKSALCQKGCSHQVCASPLNQCSLPANPYLCVAGAGRGGCSSQPWQDADCNECCILQPGC